MAEGASGPSWELRKENAAPLKRGRKAGVLGAALASHEGKGSSAVKAKLAAQRQYVKPPPPPHSVILSSYCWVTLKGAGDECWLSRTPPQIRSSGSVIRIEPPGQKPCPRLPRFRSLLVFLRG